jgi:hypothetical protein
VGFKQPQLVRNEQYQPPMRTEDPPALPERVPVSLNVFEHLNHGDKVEATFSKREARPRRDQELYIVSFMANPEALCLLHPVLFNIYANPLSPNLSHLEGVKAVAAADV